MYRGVESPPPQRSLPLETELKLSALRQALADGEASGRADYSLSGLLAELDSENAH